MPIEPNLIDNTTQEEVISNPALILVQSRLLNPGHSGPSRWAIFNPERRKSFLAYGSDVLPDAVKILAYASQPTKISDLRKWISEAKVGNITSFLDNGLIIPSKFEKPPFPNFLSRFHLANFAYPFKDYSNPTWDEDDVLLMKEYERMWQIPDRYTTRSGIAITLPTVNSLNGTSLNLDKISYILRLTFGALGEFTRGIYTALYKTSPSGGARHPTEGTLVLKNDHFGIPPGTYIYDAKYHSLVQSNIELELPHNSGLAIILRSRVERPMWRYRDLRALRPVLLDVGHIAETLHLLFGTLGHKTWLGNPPRMDSADFEWLYEPEMCCVYVADTNNGKTPSDQITNVATEIGTGSEYYVNPCMYISFENKQLVGNLVWPKISRVNISLEEFPVLGHCTPSKRGDRDISKNGILQTFLGLGQKNLDHLIDNNILLPIQLARTLYSKIGLWCRHDWYLSLLSYLETRSLFDKPAKENNEHLATLEEINLINSLTTRRTCRSFKDDSISKHTLFKLIEHSLCPVTENSLKIFVGVLKVEDVNQGLYEYKIAQKELNLVTSTISRTLVQSLTVGQFPPSQSAIVLWLLTKIDTTQPARYYQQIIDLGRIGQRICLNSANEQLGVFMTPAVTEEKLFEYFGIPDPLRWITYLLAVGRNNNG